jgi:hypothetical protein
LQEEAAIAFQVTYPAAPSVVVAVLTDRRFFSACATAIGALEHSTRVRRTHTGWSTDTRLVVPTKGIPYVFAPFVGDDVPIRLTRAWRAAEGARYACAWRVTASVRGITALVDGSAALGSAREGAEYFAVAEVDEITVPVPLRPLAVSGVESLCEGALVNEAELALQWIMHRPNRAG